jgi:hypothetical protein
MERDPRQDRDGLHVDVDGDQVIAATLEHDLLANAELMLKSKRWSGITIRGKVIPL